MRILMLLILLLVSFSLCAQSTQSNQDDKQQAVFSCLKECKDNPQNLDYKNGPCLSDDNPNWNISDWVCDVAHSPRQSEVDDRPENQCQAFRNGQSHHFVEVDDNCNLIRAV